MSFIERYFVFNNALEKLSMNDCKIDDKIAIAIGKGMNKNIKIRELYLARNLIDVSNLNCKNVLHRMKELLKLLKP